MGAEKKCSGEEKCQQRRLRRPRRGCWHWTWQLRGARAYPWYGYTGVTAALMCGWSSCRSWHSGRGAGPRAQGGGGSSGWSYMVQLLPHVHLLVFGWEGALAEAMPWHGFSGLYPPWLESSLHSWSSQLCP